MSYFRPNIEALSGYVPGEQPQTSGFVKLNTNENPYPPSPKALEAIRRAASERLRLYPDPVATAFRNAASEALGVPADWIVACNGSDDALTILTRACLSSDDLLVAPTPSYGLYRVLADIQGCRFEQRDWTPGGGLSEDFCRGAKLAMVPNPNSPTGTMVRPEELLELARRSEGLLVVDEAYVDFADRSCVPLVAECERLVVTRSLSKSYALAGARFGFLVAQPHLAATFLKVKDSYNTDAVSIAAAAAAILDREHFEATRAKILATRRRLEGALADLGFDVTPSHANFVWARRKTPLEPVYRGLKDRNILVRYFRYERHGEGLRISVGTDSEIDQLLAALREML
jgi:histidinol-phosphate aminotransferase